MVCYCIVLFRKLADMPAFSIDVCVLKTVGKNLNNFSSAEYQVRSTYSWKFDQKRSCNVLAERWHCIKLKLRLLKFQFSKSDLKALLTLNAIYVSLFKTLACNNYKSLSMAPRSNDSNYAFMKHTLLKLHSICGHLLLISSILNLFIAKNRWFFT